MGEALIKISLAEDVGFCTRRNEILLRSETVFQLDMINKILQKYTCITLFSHRESHFLEYRSRIRKKATQLSEIEIEIIILIYICKNSKNRHLYIKIFNSYID